MNTNDDGNLYWWISTIICAIWSTWNANKILGNGRVIAELEQIIKKQDAIIDEQQKIINKHLNEHSINTRKLD